MATIRSLALVDNDADDPYVRKGQVPPRSTRDYDADDPRGMNAQTARRLARKMRRGKLRETNTPSNFFGE